MDMIRHQHPGQQPGIARRRFGECSTGGCRNQKICEHGATLPCRGSQQVSAVGRRLPTAAQRAMPGRVDIGHTAMLMALDHAGYRRLPCSALGIHVATDCQRPSAGSTGEAVAPRCAPTMGRARLSPCGDRHIQERPHDAGVLGSRQSDVSRQSDQRSLLRYCRNGSFLSSTTTPLPSAMELR